MTAPRQAVRLLVLGPLEFRGIPPTNPSAKPVAPDRTALLAYLALTAGRTPRQTLRSLFWPHLPEHEAWLALNQAIFDLREALGDDLFVDGDIESVAIDPQYLDCDAIEFEELLRVGELARAMTLYRGEFLWDVYISDRPELEQWISLTRARLRAKAASACTTLSMDVADRDAAAALDWSRRAFEIERSEGALRRLMVLHDALGDSAGAVRHYERFARSLRAERSIDPSPESQKLLAEIREGQLARDRTPEGSQPRILGNVSPPPAPQRRAFAPIAAVLVCAVLIAGSLLLWRRWTAEGAKLTSSRPAFEAYREGEADLHAGRFEAAVEKFKQAVALDSTYAMGYYRLSEAANWTGESGLAGDAAARAKRLAAGLPTPDRTRIDAWSLYLRGVADSAGRLYSGMLAADSSDADAWFYLAEIQFHWGPILGTATLRSAASWDRVLRLDPRNAGALIHRLRIAAMQFDRPAFDSLSHRLDDLSPSPDREIEVRALRAFAFGDESAQRAAAADIGALDNLRQSLVRESLLSARDLRSAGRILVPVLFLHQGFGSWEQGDLLLSAQSEAATGNLQRSLAVIDSAALLQPDRAIEYRAMLATIEDLPLADGVRQSIRRQLDAPPSRERPYSTVLLLRRYLAATLDVRARDLDSARRNLSLLKALSSSGSTAADSTLARHVARLSRIVEAEIDRSEGKLAQAESVLGDPQLEPDMRIPYVWSYPRAHERFLRGVLAMELGHPREAAAWLETFPDPAAYDLPYLPWALRRRAALAEKAGERALASSLRARAEAIWPATPTR